MKEIFQAPGTIKNGIKKLLAHKNSIKKKVKIKNGITEPSGTLAPKVNLYPFNSEKNVSRNGKTNKGGRKGNGERKKLKLEEEKREKEKRREKTLKNHVEQEQILRGDVFCEKHLFIHFIHICEKEYFHTKGENAFHVMS